MDGFLKKTRSSKEYSPYGIIRADPVFDFGAALAASLAYEDQHLDVEVPSSEAASTSQAADPPTEAPPNVLAPPNALAPPDVLAPPALLPLLSGPISSSPIARDAKSEWPASPSEPLVQKRGSDELDPAFEAPLSRAKKQKLRTRNARKARRIEERWLTASGLPVPTERAIDTNSCAPASSNVDAIDLPSAQGAFIAKQGLPAIALPYVGQLVLWSVLVNELNFGYKSWDGVESRSIVDQKTRIMVRMAGRPSNDRSWPAMVRGASNELTACALECDFLPDQRKHGRGAYPILHTGFSFGGGPMEPYNVSQKMTKQRAARAHLLRHPCFIRLAGFASSAFSSAAPCLFAHYDKVVQGICANDCSLKKLFEDSVFPAATFNFGPQALTVPHRDSSNVPYGWCAITALGDYDHTRGGHLILWDLKLVIEFPPGSTILIPSAVIAHSNTPIQPGETRQSFTQYCAGSLVRWHTYGFRTEATLARKDPSRKCMLDSQRSTRWRDMLCLFSKHSELDRDNCTIAHIPFSSSRFA